uniref:Uncharacterized protein At3g27210 n=1 Tax=Anthurium amnicola TaxID=1678845 RepID=A0A1D1Y1B7_9ARAE
MGTCVSAHKDAESAVGFRVVMGTKKVYAPTPAEGGVLDGEGLLAGGFDPKSRRVEAGPGFRSPRFGSKDETFFDSRVWLESDCEDDFFSVNGDFTPSRGSTPNYQTGTTMIPQQSKALIFDGFPDTRSEPSPRKKLAEFFQETLPRESAGNESNIVEGNVQLNETDKETNVDQLPKSFDGPACLSGIKLICSGERTPNGNFTDGKEKGGKAMQCCLPSLVHSFNFNDKRKQTSSCEPHSDG